MLNILKKLLSSLVSLGLLLSITTICAIFVIRNILSGDTIANLLKNTISTNNSTDSNNYLQELVGDNNINQYINIDELGMELSTIITDTIKYESGIPNIDKPSTEKLKEQLYSYAASYEEKTGEKFDYSTIDKGIEDLNLSLTQTNTINKNNNFKEAISIIYNNKYLYIAIFIAIVCLLLLLTVNKFEDLLKELAFVALFNGIGYYGFQYAIKQIFKTPNSSTINILNIFNNIFNKISLISFSVAATLIIIFFIIKLVKRHKAKVAERSTDQYIKRTLAKASADIK